MDSKFPTTRGSAVRGAGSADAAVRAASWDALVLAYWKPAFKHVRIKWKASREEAEDLVQGFFERALEKDFFASYDAERARFRTFLRTCLDRFVSNEAKARARHKRGGGAMALAWDTAEEEIARAGAAMWDAPEEVFDREWRRSVFELAVRALRAECEESGKAACFAAFERYDLAEPDARPTYDAIAKELGVPATTVTNHLAFARRELRRLVLARLETITASDDELAVEAKVLFR